MIAGPELACLTVMPTSVASAGTAAGRLGDGVRDGVRDGAVEGDPDAGTSVDEGENESHRVGLAEGAVPGDCVREGVSLMTTRGTAWRGAAGGGENVEQRGGRVATRVHVRSTTRYQ